jgi:nitroreductase/NAD-dependent dihydropyrimidine dehydrogenase PreA subunit
VIIFQINRQTCTKCGLCVLDCPVGVVTQKKGDYPDAHRLAEKFCIKCGHCVAVCPTGSFSHREMAVESCQPIIKDLLPDPEQVSHLIRSRRSIRTYLNKAVPRELITRAIETGRYAPTGHNDQDVNWLVVDTPEEMPHLTAIGAEWLRNMIKNQPEMSAIFDFPKMVREYEAGRDKVFREAPAVVMTYAGKDSPMANIDCICAMSYFDLAAQNLGLGCCWCGFSLIAATEFLPMIEYLKIPENQRIYGCLLVGYPRYQYQRFPERKSPHIGWL